MTTLNVIRCLWFNT